MLFHRSSVGQSWFNNQVATVNIVELCQIILVFVKILTIRDLLLESFAGEPIKEVFLMLSIRSQWCSVMQMTEL